MPHGETVVSQSFSTWDWCGSVLRISRAVRGLRFDDQEAAEPFKKAAE